MPLDCTLKVVKMVNFMSHILPQKPPHFKITEEVNMGNKVLNAKDFFQLRDKYISLQAQGLD